MAEYNNNNNFDKYTFKHSLSMQTIVIFQLLMNYHIN